MKNRYTPLYFRNGKKLNNRVVIPPMASNTAATNGFVGEKTINHYKKLTSAGVGLVMVEYSYVHTSGRSEEFQLGINLDEQIEGLSQIAQVIHQTQALAGIQLTHAGGKTETQYSGGVIVAPSSVRIPVKDRELEIPKMMNLEDIQLWKDSFLKAADRAVLAGFDLVEIHAAHGYGINQWLSPLTNLRNDDYGGSISKNARLLFEIITNIRNKYPQLLLSVRMPGQDFIPRGLTSFDSLFIAQELEKLGVDIIDISSGIGGWRRPGSRLGEGYLVEEASMIQKVLSVPVIGVGGIETGQFIDEIISNNKISLAAVGRAILKAPKEWGETNLKGIMYV